MVDDDGEDCDDADFTTIQDAVDAAFDGDTIRVCEGTYPETVLIDKRLRLRGEQHGEDGRGRDEPLSDESVIDGLGNGFQLLAEGIVVDGFLFDRSRVDIDFAGANVKNNIFERQGVNAEFNGPDSPLTRIRRNEFRGGDDPEPGIGIHLDFPSTNTEIAYNRLLNSSMTLTESVRTRVRNNVVRGGGSIFLTESVDSEVTENRVIGSKDEPLADAHGGINVRRGTTNTTVRHNLVKLSERAGIVVDSSNANVIKDNKVEDNDEDGIVLVDGASRNVVKDNNITHNSRHGIVLDGAYGNLVKDNEVEENVGSGIVLGFTTSFLTEANAIVDNEVEDNEENGISVVAAGVLNNLFRENEVRGNDVVDCLDQSTDTGTEGTANIWRRNEGGDSDPDGLCVDEVEEPECAPPPPDLVSWWPGDVDADDIADDNDGTITGDVEFEDGKVDDAFNLDNEPVGPSQVVIGNPANLQLQSFTLDAWIRGDATSVVGYTAGTGGYQLLINNGFLSLSKTGVSNVNSAPELRITDEDDWHHVAVTKDGDEVIFYLDGFPSDPRLYEVLFEFTGVTFTLGSGSYHGRLDEVEAFSRALNAAEILDIFHAGHDGKCKP
ncbi:MAG: right-handed parallel beta-helix repeat-containing protein [Myxococcota bacterium]